jgi:hypothetical protein
MSVLSMLFAILNLYTSSKAICIHRYSRTGQPHPLFSKLQKQNYIVSFSYYFQFNYTWIWYNITTLVTLSILNSRLKNPFSWNFDKVSAKHQSFNQSIDLHKYLMPVSLHLLMICHVLVRHRKHYNVYSMFVMNIHGNGISSLMQKNRTYYSSH